MKKIICLVLAFSLLFAATASLVSCEAFDTPETMVTKAVAKTALQDSYAGKILMDLSFELFGEKVEMKLSSDMKAEGVKGDNPEVEMQMTIEAMGESSQTETYIQDGWSYVVSNGEGYKTKNDDGIGADDTVDSIIKDIPKDLFENTEIVKAEDGTRSVTVTIPAEVFAELYDDLVEEMLATLGETMEFVVSDAVVTVSVKDGLISCYDLAFSVTVEFLGQSFTVDASASVTFTQFGGVKVEMPESYKNFKEISK